MRSFTLIICAAVLACLIIPFSIGAQSGRTPQRGGATKKSNQAEIQPADDSRKAGGEDRQNSGDTRKDGETIKLGTTLVAVPVIVSDRNGLYIPDMKAEEFTVYEEGQKQEIVFFATVAEPFHVVLMLDTSASTEEKLGQIQRAAITFVEQLKPADNIKVISFDDQINDHGEFTNDRAALRDAITAARPGNGTKLYDAMHRALRTLQPIQGRKAIVIFTDGVDWTSDSAHYDDNIEAIEESGVIIYPIRYDTRAEVAALVRQQQRGYPTDPRVIFKRPPMTTTPPTTPGGGRTGGNDPLSLPVPPIGIPRPRTSRSPNRYPDDRHPDGRNPGGRFPDSTQPGSGYPDRRDGAGPLPQGGRKEPVDIMLDEAYRKADSYLNDLADKSGGKLYRADTLVSLPAAFAQIAAELRTQYSLGYYPADAARDDRYRKIQVRANRKDVIIRARPGYRASNAASGTS